MEKGQSIMRYQLLGKSGLRVSELCLGTMTFGETWGWGASREESRAQFDRFAGLGGNFIDTSINYTDGTSEQFIGEFIQSDRDWWVVATKYTLTRPDDGNPNGGGNSRKNMMKSVERSLRHLQTDHIDLLYLHAWDYMTPVDEVMRGLDDLVRQGKVLYVAISDTPAYIVAEANMLAELRGWSRFVGLQVPYNLIRRDIERELLPMARHWDMAVMPWGLLSSGVLTGKFLKGTDQPTRVDRDKLQLDERSINVVKEVMSIAAETGHSEAQVAINWVRQQTHRAQIIPILGARSLAQLDDQLAALEWSLTDEQLANLDEVASYEPEFPHTFLPGLKYIFGDTFDRIDNHRR